MLRPLHSKELPLIQVRGWELVEAMLKLRQLSNHLRPQTLGPKHGKCGTKGVASRLVSLESDDYDVPCKSGWRRVSPISGLRLR